MLGDRTLDVDLNGGRAWFAGSSILARTDVIALVALRHVPDEQFRVVVRVLVSSNRN